MAKILVVEDDAEVQEMLRFRLESEGYTVAAASNGLEAVTRTQEFHPDLIVLDLMVPGLTGAGVVKALQKDPSTREIPVMILTAISLTTEEWNLLSIEPNVVDVVQKAPMVWSHFLGKVKTLLAHRPSAEGQ